MEDIILIILFVIFGILGYFVMKAIDNFISKK